MPFNKEVDDMKRRERERVKEAERERERKEAEMKENEAMVKLEVYEEFLRNTSVRKGVKKLKDNQKITPATGVFVFIFIFFIFIFISLFLSSPPFYSFFFSFIEVYNKE